MNGVVLADIDKSQQTIHHEKITARSISIVDQFDSVVSPSVGDNLYINSEIKKPNITESGTATKLGISFNGIIKYMIYMIL